MGKIYTKTGDRGETSLYGGKRVSKSDLRVEAYGTVDELNSVIGVAITEISNFKKELINVQKDLLEIGSILGGNVRGLSNLATRAGEFEKLIDEMDKELPVLSNFILPGGGETGSLLHLARTVCRRAERRVVSVINQKSNIKNQKQERSIIVYLNRLSDLLFVMARFVNFKEGKKEIVWRK